MKSGGVKPGGAEPGVRDSDREATGREATGRDASGRDAIGDEVGDGCATAGGSRQLAIVNRKGLHARASARFVAEVERFDARARVARDGMEVSGDSIMGLLMLAAAQGSEIEVTTSGPEAAALMEALAVLVASRFGEDA